LLQSDINAADDVVSQRRELERRKMSWLLNPIGCTVLIACDIHEGTGEAMFYSTEGKHSV